MTLKKEMSNLKDKLDIQISGKFDFNLVQDFREAYRDLPTSVKTIEIDLHNTDYIDSSALGMLLNLQKNTKNQVDSILITRAQPQIKKILQIARFDKLFDVE
ncbi:STAS domain-containing protein [Gayadomonas joobiniege]|uniref:STAS domain-containing protein n=1 Tax=Gayadomonas joobiniege TaxID=1234606 RepID=UPI00035C3FF6|nr:STAS domain-containing protein [Gayadomonas joobiniege]